MRSSTFSYICCAFCLFAAVVCALAHDLPFLIFNFIFCMFNWYLAEWKRRLEDEQDSRDSDDTETKE